MLGEDMSLQAFRLHTNGPVDSLMHNFGALPLQNEPLSYCSTIVISPMLPDDGTVVLFRLVRPFTHRWAVVNRVAARQAITSCMWRIQ